MDWFIWFTAAGQAGLPHSFCRGGDGGLSQGMVHKAPHPSQWRRRDPSTGSLTPGQVSAPLHMLPAIPNSRPWSPSRISWVDTSSTDTSSARPQLTLKEETAPASLPWLPEPALFSLSDQVEVFRCVPPATCSEMENSFSLTYKESI